MVAKDSENIEKGLKKFVPKCRINFLMCSEVEEQKEERKTKVTENRIRKIFSVRCS